MSLFNLAALLLTLSALFGWLNHRIVRLPHSIGLLVLGLAASLLLVLLDLIFPAQHLYDQVKARQQIDFTAVLMNGMLAFLLFAGALDVDMSALRDRAWPVGDPGGRRHVISTVLVGTAFWWRGGLLGEASRCPGRWSSVRSSAPPIRSRFSAR